MDIQKFMDDRGYTQADLAEALGTSPQNVNKWVKGTGSPSYELCLRLLQIGMTVEELFGIVTDAAIPSRLPPMTSVEFVDILQEVLNNSLESIKRRLEK